MSAQMVLVGDNKYVDEKWVRRLLSRKDEKLRYKVLRIAKQIFGDELKKYYLALPIDDPDAKLFPESIAEGIAGECLQYIVEVLGLLSSSCFIGLL